MALSCKFCHKHMKEPYYYRTHLCIHLKENKYDNTEVKNEMNSIATSKFNCPRCDKKFASEYTLARHQQNTCNKKTNNLAKIKSLYDKLDENDKSELLRMIQTNNVTSDDYSSKPQRKSTNDTRSQNVSNSTVENLQMNQDMRDMSTNYTININIKPVGEENIETLKEHLADCQDILYKIAQQDAKDREHLQGLATELFKKLHFDPENPENHNIYITDKRPSVPFMVFNEDKWERSGNLETLEQEFLRIKDIIKDNVQGGPRYVKKAQEMIDYVREQSNLRGTRINVPGSNMQMDKFVSREFHNIAYNNKDVVKPTFDKTKKLRLTFKKKPKQIE